MKENVLVVQKMTEDNFEHIDINSFFNDSSIVEDKKEKVEMLTKKQKLLISQIMPQIKKIDPAKYTSFQNRLDDLEALAQAMGRFPSLLERHELVGGERTPTSLIDSLIDHQDMGDTTLQLPSKAILGKSLLVSKIHTFSSMSKYIRHS